MNSTLAATYGGIMIGIATSLMLIFNGRITGISGILHNALKLKSGAETWQWVFILGLIIGGVMSHQYFSIPIPDLTYNNPFLAIIAGLLVGVGTRVGNGCTSGHGICGISRFSTRSLAATCTFIVTGMITVIATKAIL